ncbi:MAG: acyl-CoA dehydrogenase family protein [Bacteroidota bacterium]
MANFYSDNKNMFFHLTHPLMEKIVALKEKNYEDAKVFDEAPFDFEDAIDSYDKVLNVMGEICGNILAENAESVDHDGPLLVDNSVLYAKGTQQNIDALTQAGLFGMSLPRKYNGLNFPMVPYVMAAELVSRADGGFSNIWGLQDCAETLHEFASEEINDEILPKINLGQTMAMDLTEPDAGSDLQAVQLKATWDEKRNSWYLNGVKRFITNGDAHISLVLARSEEGTKDGRGLSLFVYERDEKTMKVRRIENKMGIKGSPTCELVFKDAPARLVGDRKLGLIKYVMSLMNSARLGVGAQSLGISEAAYREAYKYAMEREQFGKAIIEFPAVYEMLASMKARIDAIRSLLYETSRYVDISKSLNYASKSRSLSPEEKTDMKYYQRAADSFTPLLKLFASEYCNQIAYDSLQIHGGTGFMKDFPIERIYRDARITTIYEGTSQLQVVAAIRSVVNGSYVAKIKEFEQIVYKPELEPLKRTLIEMTTLLEEASKIVQDTNNAEILDFQARRLVEIAGFIVMGYLLINDCMRSSDYIDSAKVMVRIGRAAVEERAFFIRNFNVDDIASYKSPFFIPST